MKWVVKLTAVRTGFFSPSALPGYLIGMVNSDNGVTPLFGENPVCYNRRSACFIRRELLRSGFNAKVRPYFWFVFLRMRALKKTAKAKWK